MYLLIYLLQTNCRSGFTQVKCKLVMSLCDLAPIYTCVLFQHHLEVGLKVALHLQRFPGGGTRKVKEILKVEMQVCHQWKERGRGGLG